MQVFSTWATHVIRLTKGSPYVEVEWTAGPVPVDTPWMPPVAHHKKNQTQPLPNVSRMCPRFVTAPHRHCLTLG
jgi:alpha-mannosidase